MAIRLRIPELEAKIADLEARLHTLELQAVRAWTMYNGQYIRPDGAYVQTVDAFVGVEPPNGVNGPNPKQRDFFVPILPKPSA